MNFPQKSATKATLGTGLSFAVAGSSLFTLTPAIANGATECTDTPQEIASGVFEVVCDTAGSGTWIPPENVTALEALLIAGGGDGTTDGSSTYGGGGGQVLFVTDVPTSGEISFRVGVNLSDNDDEAIVVAAATELGSGYAFPGTVGDAPKGGFSQAPAVVQIDQTPTYVQVDPSDSTGPSYFGAGTGGADGSGVTPSAVASTLGLSSTLWPALENEAEYGVGGGSSDSPSDYGAGGFGGGDAGEPGAVIFRYTLGSSNSTPAPYSGPIITDIGEDNIAAPYQTFGGQTVRVDGERLSGVTKVVIDGKEGTVVSTADDHFVMISPEGLTPGTYDLVVQSSIGNLTYLDGFIVTEASANFSAANAICEGVEPSWWTQRISDTEAKAYIKCPAVGEKYRILQQTGGSGSYDSIFAKTLTDENDTTQVFNEFGRYIVRTIDLEGINRIRIRVDDEELWKVRYNNPPTGVVTY